MFADVTVVHPQVYEAESHRAPLLPPAYGHRGSRLVTTNPQLSQPDGGMPDLRLARSLGSLPGRLQG
jgi:hypothetical protein